MKMMLGYYIEDYPFITRFKTGVKDYVKTNYSEFNIEDYPFITRFKTIKYDMAELVRKDIEDYPFITRFKTPLEDSKS